MFESGHIIDIRHYPNTPFCVRAQLIDVSVFIPWFWQNLKPVLEARTLPKFLVDLPALHLGSRCIFIDPKN